MNNDRTDNSILKRVIVLIVSVLIIVAADQATKIWAVKALMNDPVVLIDGVFELRYLENHGAAFGVFQGAQTFFLIITAVFLIAASFVCCRIPRTRRLMPLRLTLILMTGGAVGNLIDRVKYQYVRDFLYFKLIDFPIFNVADICVTVSAFLLAVLILFIYKEDDLAFLKFGRSVDKKANE